MRKIIFLRSLLFSALFMALPAISAPISVQSVLFDADHDLMTVAPPVAQPPDGNPIQDGDFTIFRIAEAVDPTVGNGIDDRTRGLFDFRGNANYGAFSEMLALTHGKIFGATLSLALTAKNTMFTNDQISLENGPFVGSPEIGNQLQLDTTKIINIDLLDYYSQAQLENFLSGGVGDFNSDGRIVLVFGDDAILTGASLLLTANIPEPGTIGLLLLGLLPVFVVRAGRPAGRNHGI